MDDIKKMARLEYIKKNDTKHIPKIKTLLGFKRFLNSKNRLDWFYYDGFLYIEESFDIEGKEHLFASIDAKKRIEVITEDRYTYGYKNAEIIFSDMDWCRTDICYATLDKKAA